LPCSIAPRVSSGEARGQGNVGQRSPADDVADVQLSQASLEETPPKGEEVGRALSVTGDAIGSVASLWRYPVKSMMGEELNAGDVTERGLVGDRAYGLIDRATAKLVSAKHPRKWVRLFDFHAVFVVIAELLWIVWDQAAPCFRCAWRSTRAPSTNGPPARTSGISAAPSSRRQCACAASSSLNAIVRPAVREPAPFVWLNKANDSNSAYQHSGRKGHAQTGG
jgi:MOSC N-terminal beta barrel domain